jgi:hypothetical protein
MRHLAILALLASLATAAALLPDPASAGSTVSRSPRLLAFGGHLAGRHLGGRPRLGQPRVGFGGFARRGSSRSLLHRIAHALAFAYILYLAFSHGGISIIVWLLLIGLVVQLVRRRRAPRNTRAY